MELDIRGWGGDGERFGIGLGVSWGSKKLGPNGTGPKDPEHHTPTLPHPTQPDKFLWKPANFKEIRQNSTKTGKFH